MQQRVRVQIQVKDTGRTFWLSLLVDNARQAVRTIQRAYGRTAEVTEVV